MNGKSEPFPYEDIVGLPHHRSATRKPMSAHDRAAQFSPFAALTGYGDAVEETARTTEERTELTEEARRTVEDRLPIDQASYASAKPNTVVELKYYSGTYTLNPASSAVVDIAYYTDSDPFTDYTDALRICYNGQAGGEPVERKDVTLNKYKPKLKTPVIYLYTTESLGYGSYTVRRVKTVWFTTAS